jgi:ribosomal protein L37E
MSLIKKAEAIVSGWANYAEGEPPSVEALRRASICAACPHAKKKKLLQWVGDDIEEIKGYACDLCGCPLSAKIRQDISLCDAGKW